MHPIFEIVLVLLAAFIGGCGYMIRGGSRWFFSSYFKNKTPIPDKVPGCRWIGDAVSTFGFASVVIFKGLNLWLIPVFFVGWYFTIVFGWGKIFGCKTLQQRGLFFLRMSLSGFLFLSLTMTNLWPFYANPIIYIRPLAYTIFFAACAMLYYWLYNLNKNNTDDSFNTAEFWTGIQIVLCALGVAVGSDYIISHI
jgi:hypothetical protein